MSRRDNLELAESQAEHAAAEPDAPVLISGSNAVREILRALPNQQPVPLRWWTAGLWIQVVLCALLFAGVWALRGSLQELRDQTSAQRQTTQGWVSQAGTLTDQTQALKAE